MLFWAGFSNLTGHLLPEAYVCRFACAELTCTLDYLDAWPTYFNSSVLTCMTPAWPGVLVEEVYASRMGKEGTSIRA